MYASEEPFVQTEFGTDSLESYKIRIISCAIVYSCFISMFLHLFLFSLIDNVFLSDLQPNPTIHNIQINLLSKPSIAQSEKPLINENASISSENASPTNTDTSTSKDENKNRIVDVESEKIESLNSLIKAENPYKKYYDKHLLEDNSDSDHIGYSKKNTFILESKEKNISTRRRPSIVHSLHGDAYIETAGGRCFQGINSTSDKAVNWYSIACKQRKTNEEIMLENIQRDANRKFSKERLRSSSNFAN